MVFWVRFWFRLRDTKIEDPSRVRRHQEREEIFKAGHCPFSRQTWATRTASKKKLWTSNTVRPYICHLDRQNQNRYNFFSHFLDFGIWVWNITIDWVFFFFVDMFTFYSFLFRVFGFSIKMFVISILDICFCSVF